MLRPISLMMALGLSFWAVLAAAQEDGTSDDAPAESPAESSETSPFQDIGTPEGEADGNEPFIRDVFGDWSLRCIRTEAGDDQCQLYQLLLGPDGTPISEVSIVPLANGGNAAAGAVVVVPLETQLTAVDPARGWQRRPPLRVRFLQHGRLRGALWPDAGSGHAVQARHCRPTRDRSRRRP